MESIGLLEPDCEADLFALHYVFIPRINNHLLQFKRARNNHPLRGEEGLSPLQLWTRGMHSASAQNVQDDILHGLSVPADYGVEPGNPFSDTFDQPSVVVPEIDLHLSGHDLSYIRSYFVPLCYSEVNGLDLYIELRDYLLSTLNL